MWCCAGLAQVRPHLEKSRAHPSSCCCSYCCWSFSSSITPPPAPAYPPVLVSAGKAYTLAQRKREGQPLDTDEMTALTTCVQVYLDSGEPVEALQATLIKTVCWDDWSEMHMWKAVGAAPNPSRHNF